MFVRFPLQYKFGSLKAHCAKGAEFQFHTRNSKEEEIYYKLRTPFLENNQDVTFCIFFLLKYLYIFLVMRIPNSSEISSFKYRAYI